MNDDSRELVYDEIKTGDNASFSSVIDEKMVDEFGKLSGDTNPHR